MTIPSSDSRVPADAIPAELDALVGEWLALPDVAERLDVVVTRVHSLVKDRRLIAVRRPEPAVRAVPALFLDEEGILDSLRGTLVLLQDAGYSDAEALRWLFTPDESLPGRPIDALRGGHKTEVRRRAQALAW
ncbi:DNA-binding protein [Micrococcus sp. EYE_162]|uniref:Rv2175c family DNA-binding protein n=1 Tax=unclassified Micrococcus TaxID=2620948 RepID=UPI002005BB92|nr:DNA-binding protein [Micrococcus sp. EYE_212]MCK6172114.1 DNA-binding protein [Micrococcus sp. EYE_162]